MRYTRCLLMTAVLLAALLPQLASAQGVRRVNVPYSAPNSGQVPEVKELSANYLVTLTVRSGAKEIAEIAFLTASPRLETSAAIDSATPVSASLVGTLEEKEGGLLAFDYKLSSNVPRAQAAAPGANGPPGVFPSNQYPDHRSSGIVLMKPGHSYDLLKADGYTYTLSIAKAKEE